MAKKWVTSKAPRVQREGKNPPALRGVVVTYAKVMRPNPKFASLLEEIDVEVRQFGPKDYRVTADGTRLEQGTYKDLGAANQVFRHYVERKKREGWKVLNERENFDIDESGS